MTQLSLCVYCGSRMGQSPAFEAIAREVGRQIGERGWRLVYGGGSTGLMGAVADSALAAGAEVIGVIPDRLIQRELGHGGVTELQVVGSMHERKHQMAVHSDAFLALPGGIGTMEEIFEVPIGLLNVDGYYDDLLRFIDRSRDSGFLWPDVQELLLVDQDVTAMLDRLEAEHARLQKQTPPESPDAGPGGVVPGT